MQISAFTRRNPVLLYYFLTFGLSWGAILAAVGPHGFPASAAQISKTLPVLMVAMLLGPTIASIFSIGVTQGWNGYRDLFSRLLKWRVGIKLWGVAILLAPLLLMAVPLALSAASPQFIPRIFTDPNKRSLLQLGIAAGMAAGVFEELGWTGFVIPRLRQRFSVVGTGAIVGFLWGAWHIPIIALQIGIPSDANGVLTFLGAIIGILPAYRVVMVWVYDRSQSLLLAMIMHASLSNSTIIFALNAARGMTSQYFNLAVAGAVWIAIAVSSAASRNHSTVHALHS